MRERANGILIAPLDPTHPDMVVAIRKQLGLKKGEPNPAWLSDAIPEDKAATTVADLKAARRMSMAEGEQQIQTVRIIASQFGRRGVVNYSVQWQEGDSVVSQSGYRTLEDAMAFCPCSMDPDKVEREVAPGVRVSNPIPRNMCGHAGGYLMLDGKKVPGSEVPPNLYAPEDIEEEIVATTKKKAAPLAKDVRARLTELRSKIFGAHERVEDAAVEGLRNAREAGEALIEAKGLCQHGEWLPFLGQCDESLTERTAQAYMQVAKHWARLSLSNAQRVADLSFREALKLLAAERKGEQLRARQARLDAKKDVEPEDGPEPEPEDAAAAARRARIEAETKREARRAKRHAFALRIIESGYKVEAKKVHPDKGGSTEDMQMLTEMRDALLRDALRCAAERGFFDLENVLEEVTTCSPTEP